MSNEEEQFAQRLAKLEELRRLGVAPYPTRFERTATVQSVVSQFGASEAEALEADRPKAAVAGRVLGVRSFGKARFLVLSDGLDRLQVYVRADAMDERSFQIVTHVDLGDHVGVEGRVFRTKTKELTIWAERIEFLVKGLLPLPEKWHGLTDIETRYRQRYLDLIVNPESRQVFETRARVIAAIRRFLDGRGFLEVETPMMQPIAGGALARPFVTHHNTLDLELYLRVAPELYLKRLVVGGFERVYEINRNFRNEGISTQHNPEFTMLEFYEAYVDYHHLITLDRDDAVARSWARSPAARTPDSASRSCRSRRPISGFRCVPPPPRPPPSACARQERRPRCPSPKRTCAIARGPPRSHDCSGSRSRRPTAPARSP